MPEFAGRGDPRRTMELLWGRTPPAARGPAAELTPADVVRAAIAVADEEGLARLTMRRIAERLGRSTMSLYTYVPGKPELLDLMLDAIHAELPTAYDRSGGWRQAAEAFARDQWHLLERHPWSLDVAGGRTPLGPHTLDAYEAQLAVFDGLGLDGVEMTRAVAAVTSFIRGAAQAIHEARTAQQATGLSDDDWWNAHAPLLEEVMDPDWPERHPTATKLQRAQAFDHADRDTDDPIPYLVVVALDAFEYGLARMLDGIAAHIARRGGVPA
ncbi:MAG TPA: TetR/AcrR family transcriptional regulator [Euzebyales bacterium]|nr:TetR/AcrR family transcriptional regulator [Euzebyales bacterium]